MRKAESFLVIEDDDQNAEEAVSRLQEAFGGVVHHDLAWSGDHYDVVLLDLMFGDDLVGPDIYREIVQRDRGCIVIAWTQLMPADERIQSLVDQGVPYVWKLWENELDGIVAALEECRFRDLSDVSSLVVDDEHSGKYEEWLLAIGLQEHNVEKAVDLKAAEGLVTASGYDLLVVDVLFPTETGPQPEGVSFAGHLAEKRKEQGGVLLLTTHEVMRPQLNKLETSPGVDRVFVEPDTDEGQLAFRAAVKDTVQRSPANIVRPFSYQHSA